MVSVRAACMLLMTASTGLGAPMNIAPTYGSSERSPVFLGVNTFEARQCARTLKASDLAAGTGRKGAIEMLNPEGFMRGRGRVRRVIKSSQIKDSCWGLGGAARCYGRGWRSEHKKRSLSKKRPFCIPLTTLYGSFKVLPHLFRQCECVWHSPLAKQRLFRRRFCQSWPPK